MEEGQRGPPVRPPPADGEPDRAGEPPEGPPADRWRDAEAHLAELADVQRRTIPDREVHEPGAPARLGGWIRVQYVRAGLAFEQLRRALRSPRHWLGQRRAWIGLLSKRQFFELRVVSLIVVIGAGVALNQTKLAEEDRLLWSVATAAFTGSFLGLAALLWSDFLRSPQLAWRVRREIVRNPDRILPTTPGSTQTQLFTRDDQLERIPRGDLYDEVIPGILAGDRRDVQIIVGEPGSGKTTALVGLAALLAKIGMVPVLVPLRGETNVVDLVTKARETFERQVYALMRSDAERDALWRWLRRRKRIAILTDDIDQIGSDGERGFVLRRALEVLATEDIAVVVTARPAGIPAGVAATAIDLGELDEAEVVDHLERTCRADLSSRGGGASRKQLEYWVHEGRLTEVPFYLELLALLASAGECPELSAAGRPAAGKDTPGQYRRMPDGTCEWNPLWVRFMLLDNYYNHLRAGAVRRGLGIEHRERRSALKALEGAALGVLLANGLAARPGASKGESEQPMRRRVEEFIDTDDRAGLGVLTRERREVSAHEVVDSGERMRLLDREHDGTLEFRHRIMQAYLASRRLMAIERARPPELGPDPGPDPSEKPAAELSATEILIDSHHPEKLTAHMTLTFAALGAVRKPEDEEQAEEKARLVGEGIVASLAVEAEAKLARQAIAGTPPAAPPAGTGSNGAAPVPEDVDPLHSPDPENRADPDDALIKITTAAEITRAIGSPERRREGTDERAELVKRLRKPAGRPPRSSAQARIVALAQAANGATRWTKLGAIRALAALSTDERWQSIWEFTRDPDYSVRRAACAELEKSALDAYRALHAEIDDLIRRAAERSARDLPLMTEDTSGGRPGLEPWHETWHILPLKALGWMLPAIVSGLREDPWSDSSSEADGDRAAHARSARRALDQLVALAFSKKGHHDLEASLAQGFKGDAMRHAEGIEGRVRGPGWVAANRGIVADICVPRATFWYARMLLHQALGLYAIVGLNPDEALDAYAGIIEKEEHPLARRAARLSRVAVERGKVDSGRWRGLIWDDEGAVVGRRPTALDDSAARLVADVTLLLNLNEGTKDGRSEFGSMSKLPHCLSESPDRTEILGKGCDSDCGWGLCPYKQPPPDEPNAHRGVSRAFCRHQRRIAKKPPWQPAIGNRRIAEFWEQMERRART